MRRPLVAAVVLAVALAACGSGSAKSGSPAHDSNVSTVALLANAPAKAADAGSARFEMTFTLPAGTRGQMGASGVVDFADNDMQMTMNLRDVAPNAPDVTYEARMVDGVVYMNIGSALAGASLPDGMKPWIKVDPSSVGVSRSQLDQSQNPADLLESLKGVADIREVGHDTVRGVDTTEYAGTVDLAKALDRAGSDVRSRLQKALSAMETSVPVKVWVDDEGLPRRMQMDISVQGMSMSMTMEFYDYGTPVDVAAPPASEVGDMSSLIGSASALAG
jgi:hypothetical protein